ncbi:MAG: T9SS type A sorting domain-containing protein [bacterium]
MRQKTHLLTGVLCFVVVTMGFAQTYVGSSACQLCHSSKYNTWVNSGHHYKLVAITGGQPPVYPFQYHSGTPNVVNPPEAAGTQLTWNDVSYVIGGYYWKARFIDQDGYIITGDASDSTQWNVWSEAWVPYSAGQIKPYDCGTCHTTGYDPQGNQGGLPGIVGTWEEEGIGCEACHGPGSDHIAGPSSSNISLDTSSELCGQCHYRDSQHRIAASGGWIQHHEQYDEMLHSPHYDYLTCSTCHNPHASTVYEQGGLKPTPTCANCHTNYVIPGMEMLECWDCHMPYSAKSATASGYAADVSSHQFRIWVTTFPKDSMFYNDGGSFVKLDSGDQVYGNTLDLVCLRCHSTQTISDLYWIADNIHTEGLGVEPIVVNDVPREFALGQNYPNPFNPETMIEFTIPKDDVINLAVFDVNGRLVRELYSGDILKGTYQINFIGENLASGVYLYRLSCAEQVLTKKMILFK